ncbi:MAG TPA: DUF3823 domain-containing protein [Parapedobacter sp.]|nr:DUF3823 domain-containing protein [Parapedobacter sp.]
MNNIRFIISFVILATIASCKVDNYDAPSATLYGSFIDSETNEPVPSEIVQGTVIQLIEHGWVVDQTNITQSLVVKSDGTFTNSMIFPGKYRISAVQGNFQPIAPLDTVEIKGQTKLDFIVTPYLRIKDAEIVKSGSKVTATFSVERTTDDNIATVALFSHPNAAVGTFTSLVKTEQTTDLSGDPNHVYTLEIDLNNPNLLPGRSYYFRIGALSSVAGARFNYSHPIQLTI